MTYARAGQPFYLAISGMGFLASAILTSDPLQAGGVLEWLLSYNRGYKIKGLVKHQAGELLEVISSTSVQLYAAQCMSPGTSAWTILQLLVFAGLSMAIALPEATVATASTYTYDITDFSYRVTEVPEAEIPSDFYPLQSRLRGVKSHVKWLPSICIAIVMPGMHYICAVSISPEISILRHRCEVLAAKAQALRVAVTSGHHPWISWISSHRFWESLAALVQAPFGAAVRTGTEGG